jgi:hypothetical protein
MAYTDSRVGGSAAKYEVGESDEGGDLLPWAA